MSTGRDEEVSLKRRFLWTKWEGNGFPERVNHAVTSCNVDGHRYMYAFGGFRGRGTVFVTGHEMWNDLGEVPMDVIQFDLDTCSWTKLYPSVDIPVPSCKQSTMSATPPTSGTIPGRYAHSCAWYKGRIFMYGGRNDYRFFNEIECYDPVTGSWSVIKATTEDSGTVPTGRYAHACTTNGPIMYIQGGTTLDSTGRSLLYTSELLSFNLESHVWRTESDGRELDLEVMPLARDFHSGVYSNGRIIVFGGKCPFPNEDDDGFYEYKFGTSEWKKLETTGYHPPGRRSLQAVPYGEESVIYFGGYSTGNKIFYSDLFIFNTDTKHVLKLKPFGIGPCPRRRVGLCLLGSELVVCGGVGRNQSKEKHHHTLMTFDDTYTLHLVPSLEHLCKETIINNNLSFTRLPAVIQQTITTMMNEKVVDSQPLQGDLHRTTDMHTNK